MKETVTLLGEQKRKKERERRAPSDGKCKFSRRASRPPPDYSTTSAPTWPLQPEFAEAVLVLLEHVPHPQAAAVRPVPFLQLQEAGVTAERHDAEGSWS